MYEGKINLVFLRLDLNLGIHVFVPLRHGGTNVFEN
jgi:hypothetical protein